MSDYVEMAKAALARHQALKDSGLPAPPTGPPPIPEVLRLPAPTLETPIRNLVTRYQFVLGRLYALSAMDGPDADSAECHRLLHEQQRLQDDLGPEFAAAIDRQRARLWAPLLARGPSCGAEARSHDPTSCEAIALTRGWPVRLEGLGRRTVGPLAPCADCGAGSWACYRALVLCHACAETRRRA